MKPSNTGRILIYRNSQKINGDNTPEYRGGLLLDGKTYDIGLWVYQAKSGKIYVGICDRDSLRSGACEAECR
jgi:hypothetical protein